MAIRRYLKAVADPDVCGACLQGRYGVIAQHIAMEDCSKLLHVAELSLEDVDVDLVETEGLGWKSLNIKSGPTWSAYDLAVMEAIGNALREGMFLDETFRLFKHTDERCQSILIDKADAAGVLSRSDAAQLFASLYVFMPLLGHNRTCFPASAIYHAIHSHFRVDTPPKVVDTILRVSECLESQTPGELLLTCALLKFAHPVLHPVVPRLLRVCWNTGIYHLRLDALQVAEWNAHNMQGVPREEVKAFLAPLQSRNLGLSTSIVEAMLAYNMVQAPLCDEDVAHGLTELLKTPDDPIAQKRAYGAVANMFEDIYQGAFYEAIEALPRDQRVQLLTMAALGASEYACWTDWILSELVKAEDSQALPAFLHCATNFDTETSIPHETVACFVWAMMGCSQYLEAPPHDHLQTIFERVWEAYGTILFWMYKPGRSYEQKRAASLPSWERLRTSWPFEAVDPLVQLGQAKFGFRKDFQPLDDLCAMFPDEVRWILEFGLKNRDRLTSLFGRYPIRQDEVATIIRSLGVVGNHRTVKLLEQLVDTPDFGTHALDAIRKLKTASSPS